MNTQLQSVLDEITGSSLYSKPRAGDYEPWYVLARLTSSILDYLEDESSDVEGALKVAKEWSEQASSLPKYRRDSEFRRSAKVVSGLVDVFEELLPRVRKTRKTRTQRGN